MTFDPIRLLEITALLLPLEAILFQAIYRFDTQGGNRELTSSGQNALMYVLASMFAGIVAALSLLIGLFYSMILPVTLPAVISGPGSTLKSAEIVEVARFLGLLFLMGSFIYLGTAGGTLYEEISDRAGSPTTTLSDYGTQDTDNE